MIIQDQSNNIERGGGLQENSFTIKASEKAFQILSSQLYSNKILAVIREYICNAIDAHKEERKCI